MAWERGTFGHNVGQRSLSIPSSVSSPLELIEVRDSVTGLTVSPGISPFCQSSSCSAVNLLSQHSRCRLSAEPVLPRPSLRKLSRGFTAFCFHYSHRFPVQISDFSLPFAAFSLTTADNWSLLSSLQKGEPPLSWPWTARAALGDALALCHLLGMSANGHQVTLTFRMGYPLQPENS